MRTDLIFYEPHEQARKKPKPAMPTPQLSVNHEGTFRFNAAATDLLGLHPNARVTLGNARNDPREWFLMRVKEAGWPSRNFNHGLKKSQSLGFKAAPLRAHLLDTLPYALGNALLTFKLDALTVLEESGAEIWPLLTAPYYVPPEAQAPKPEPPVHRRVLALMVPGLLGVLHNADLP
jgi:hypothetical protein